MEERDWLIIRTLNQYKNITKTAQALFISQPSLTARIRQIETDLGVKMICRGSRGVRFTAEGDYLAGCAERLLLDFRRIRERAGSIGSRVKGVLRLGAPQYIIQHKLPDLLGAFKRRHPEVEYEITTAWSGNIIRLLHSNELHVGFVRNDYGWPAQEKQLLSAEKICVASRERLRFADLPDLPRVEYNTDYSYKAFLEQWWRENFAAPPRIGMTVGNIDICKAMVQNGLGYGIVPSGIFTGRDEIYQIEIENKQGLPIVRNTWMIYQREILELKVSEAFVRFVQEMR